MNHANSTPPFKDVDSLASWEDRDHTAVPGDPLLEPGQTPRQWVQEELDVHRLNRVHRYLWFAGRLGNIRQLHSQQMLGRHIVVTERADMHLVWFDTTIFMKPLPPWLLNWEFWAQNICAGDKEENSRDLYLQACGFLYTYTRLVRSRSDLEIAHRSNLIPREIEWARWAAFVRSVQNTNMDPLKFPDSLNNRWWYGELRLNRLNIIYRMVVRNMRGYHYRCRRYKNFLESNFAWVIAVFGYSVTILTAMQVILALPKAEVPQSFRIASWGFGVTCIMVPIILLFVILMITLVLVVSNVSITLLNERNIERLRRKSVC